MIFQPRPPLTLPSLVSPLAVSALFILLLGLLREPTRRQFSAIMLAGAGAAYLSGGFGAWEFGFCALMTVVAYRALQDYRFAGAGWVLHTLWDGAHHLWGQPIIPFFPLSSVGCAICDLGLAAWYFAGAPSPYPWIATSDRD